MKAWSTNPKKPPQEFHIKNAPLAGTEEMRVEEAVNALMAKQMLYRDKEREGSANNFATIFVVLVQIGIIATILLFVSHDLAAIARISQADAQIEKAVNQQLNGGVSFLDKIQIAKSYADQTWFPMVGDLARGSATSSAWEGVSCVRDQNPFGYLMGRGDGIGFSDLNDSAGQAFMCTSVSSGDSATTTMGSTTTVVTSSTP